MHKVNKFIVTPLSLIISSFVFVSLILNNTLVSAAGGSLPSVGFNITSTGNPTNKGENVVVSVNIFDPSSSTIPTGTADFIDSISGDLGTRILDSSGNVSITLINPAIGSHDITVKYSGNSSYSGDTSPIFTQNVASSNAVVFKLSSSLNPAQTGQSVIFNINVSGNPSLGVVPNGNVTFTDSVAGNLGTFTLDGSGNAQVTKNSLAVGNHNITVSYSGDGTYGSQNSDMYVQTINTPLAANCSPSYEFNGYMCETYSNATNIHLSNNNRNVGEYGMYVDPKGNVYVLNSISNQVEYVPSGSTTAQLISNVDLNNPVAIYADADQNVYITNADSSVVVFNIVTPLVDTVYNAVTGGSTSTIYVDSARNIYFADNTFNHIVKIAHTTGNISTIDYSSVAPINVSFLQINFQTNDFYLAESTSGLVVYIPNGSPSNIQTRTSGTNLTAMIEGNDDALYITDYSTSLIYRISNNFLSSSTIAATGANQGGLVVDPFNSLYNIALGSSTYGKIFNFGQYRYGAVIPVAPDISYPFNDVVFIDNNQTMYFHQYAGFVANNDEIIKTTLYDIPARNYTVTSTTTTLTPSLINSPLGNNVVLKATVTGSFPRGKVVFYDDNKVLGSVPLNPVNNSATLPAINFLGLGHHSLYASFKAIGTSNKSISSIVDENIINKVFITPTIEVTSNLNPSQRGNNVTFKIHLTDPTATNAPSGNIIFKDDISGILGTIPVNGIGDARITANFQRESIHHITAQYSGDTNYNSVQSTPFSQFVGNLPPVVFNLTSDINPSNLAQTVTFNLNISDSSSFGIPSGSVTFNDNISGDFASVSLDASGNATTIDSSLTPGIHIIRISYSGDRIYSGADSQPYTQTVTNLRLITANLTSNNNPSNIVANVTFSVQIIDPLGLGTPSGNVIFNDNVSGDMSTVALDSSGNASFSTTTLSPGSHNITAVYQGDQAYAGGTSSILVQNVSSTPIPVVDIVADPNPSPINWPITLQLSVLQVGNLGIPTGSIIVSDSISGNIGTVNLDGNGNASITYNPLLQGNHVITALYSGDGVYSPNSTNYTSVAVPPINTISTIISTLNPARVGQNVTFVVTVVPNSSPFYEPTFTPTGGFRIFEGSNLLGTGTLDASGVGFLHFNNLSIGTHSIYVNYLGNLSFNTSNSSPINQIIVMGQDELLTLNTNKNPVLVNDLVTLTAHLSGPAGVPSGIINFQEGNNVLTSSIIDTFGNAIFSTNSLSLGTHTISATYEGNSIYNPNSTSIQEVITNKSNFNVIIAGKDARTNLTQTTLGSTISWNIQYFNSQNAVAGAKIYFPLQIYQSYVTGSIKVPMGWQIDYSTDLNCADNTFTYISNSINGNTDLNIKCIRFFDPNTSISSPANSSGLTQLSVNTVSVGGNISNYSAGDTPKVTGYKSKIYGIDHHITNQPSSYTKLLTCYDINKSNDSGGFGANCDSTNSTITYPVALGTDGLSLADQFDVNIPSTAYSIVLGNKLYFPYADDSGGGIMCWNMDTDNYCSGGGLNVRGEIQLHNYPWYISADGFSTMPTPHGTGYGQGVNHDIVYNSVNNELYTLVVDGNIACYSLTTGARCLGQEDSPVMSGYFTGEHFNDGVGLPVPFNTGSLVLVNNKLYGTLSGTITNHPVICLDTETKLPCTNWNTPQYPLPDQGIYSITTLNVIDNQMCAHLTNYVIHQPETYCYNESTNSFHKIFNALDSTNSGLISNGGVSDRVYMAQWGNTNLYCYLTTVDVNTGVPCPGWENGKPTPIFDDQIYSATTIDGCVFIATNHNNIFVMDPVTGGSCSPKIITSVGQSYAQMDASTYFCGQQASQVSWDQLVYNDLGVTPNPVSLSASVYDLNQCSFSNNVYNCVGTPLKSANLLLTSNHSLDISSISYSQHPALLALVNYNYPTVPTPIPNFFLKLNNSFTPQICLKSVLGINIAQCTNILTQTCANANATVFHNQNQSPNSSACLSVAPYGGKVAGISTTSDGITSTIVCSTGPNLNPTSYPLNPNQTDVTTSSSGGSGSGVVNTINNIITTIIGKRQNPIRIDQTTPLVINGLLLLGLGIATIPAILSSFAGSSLNIFQILGLIAGVLFPKRRRYWGIIYDELENKPIPFAVINLIKVNPNNTIFIRTTVSDLSGRYRLDIDKKDTYKVEIKSSGYIPQIKNLNINYFFNRYEIVADIPMLKEGASINIFKKLSYYKKDILLKLFSIISLILSILGIIITLVLISIDINIISILLFIIYLIIIIINLAPIIIGLRLKVGIVSQREDGKVVNRLPGATVRIYDNNRQLQIGLSNEKGIVRFNLPTGKYKALTTKKGYLMDTTGSVTTPLGLVERTIGKNGFLNKDLPMKKTTTITSGFLLDSPFS